MKSLIVYLFAVRLSERCPLSGLLFLLALHAIGLALHICVTQRSLIAHYLASHMYSRVYKLCLKCAPCLCLRMYDVVILLLLLYHYLIWSRKNVQQKIKILF